ncbi:MAG TPA: GAF domain-containing protein, partial [Paracoccaceae bacterium]|nr:GAF domain-containing protein [Paracoccaceae bacterium]
MAGVPIFDEGAVWGAIILAWPETEMPEESHIGLVQTFAAQASIAIRNARLFNETLESLEQQTATAEVLKAISRSAFDLPSVLHALIKTAARLCDASICILFRREGNHLIFGANHGCNPEMVEFHKQNPLEIGEANITGRAAMERRTVHIADVLEIENYQNMRSVQLGGWRSIMAVPLIQNEEAIGVLALARPTPGLFNNRQVELMETFADQAVIAISNANLFSEVQARTTEVTEALEYQTATTEVLGVISRSPNELQPVLETILSVAARICNPQYAYAALLNADDGRYHIVSTLDVDSEFFDFLRANPVEPGYGTCTGRTALLGETVYIEDTENDDSYVWKEAAHRGNYLSTLGIPLNKDGVTVGVLAFSDSKRSAFSAKQIALLETFASQAVIAIGNARLFDEVQQRTAELTEALEQQKASAEILSVISQSVADTQPVFEKILESCQKL